MSSNTGWPPETLVVVEKIKSSLLAAMSANLGDDKVLRDILSPLIDAFDALAPKTKSEVFLIFTASIMSWIDLRARQPEMLPLPSPSAQSYVT